MTEPTGALTGIRVVDLTHILAGPFATQLLADAGADVIKLEPPGGEFSRVRGPQRRGADGATLSSYSAAVNRGKRSIELDLKHPKAHAIAILLIEQADVLVENFAPGAVSRLGLDFAHLRERFPNLVTCSISLWGGFESAAELARRGGLAIVAEAESTIMGTTRDRDGNPVPLGTPVSDMASGLAAYAAIVTALLERERTGRGRHVEISMVRTLLTLNSTAITGKQIASANEYLRTPVGYGVYPTRDGFLVLGVNTDRLWGQLCEVMGRPDLASDPRFGSYSERDARNEEGNAIVREWTLAHTSQELMDLVGPTGLPCGRIVNPEDVLEQGSDVARLGWLLPVEDGLGGTVEVPTNTFGWTQAENRIARAGEATESVLATELGISPEEYAALAAEGVFGPRPRVGS
jgi:crotonobetainyl-CoA:carnitine CoA-transferase CaiB-like acyl-CoA transferase